MSIKDKAKKVARSVWSWLVAAALAVGAFFGINDAESQTATDTVSWVLPTQRIDGSALPVSQIAKTTVAWGTSAGGPYPNSQDVAAPGTSFIFTRSAPVTGQRCYVAFVTDTDGRVSGQSAESCKTVVAAPRPPTGLTAQ